MLVPGLPLLACLVIREREKRMGLFRQSKKELIEFYQYYFPGNWEEHYNAHIKARRGRTKSILGGIPIIGGVFRLLFKI